MLDFSFGQSVLYPNPSKSDIIFLIEEVSKLAFYNSQGGIMLDFDTLTQIV